MSATVSDKDLLAWILSQDRLRVERWHHPGGRESVSVYTALDDEDEPSGRAPTARAALVQAYRQWLLKRPTDWRSLAASRLQSRP